MKTIRNSTPSWKLNVPLRQWRIARKKRKDTKLKNLPPAWQARIIRDMDRWTLDQICLALRRSGLETSVTGLSVFRQWYLEQKEGPGAGLSRKSPAQIKRRRGIRVRRVVR
jgi:hypothetical protein